MKAVAHYLPHKPPMRFLDKLLEAQPRRVVVAATVKDDNPFLDADAGLPAWVGIEYLAQAAAVWLGIHCELQGKPIAPAFLISARQYRVQQPMFAVGSQLFIEVRVDMIAAPVVAFTGAIRDVQGELLVDAIFSAYQPDDLAEFLEQSAPDHE